MKIDDIFEKLPHDEEEIVMKQIDKMINNYLGNTKTLDATAMATQLITLQLAAKEYENRFTEEFGIDIEID